MKAGKWFRRTTASHSARAAMSDSGTASQLRVGRPGCGLEKCDCVETAAIKHLPRAISIAPGQVEATNQDRWPHRCATTPWPETQTPRTGHKAPANGAANTRPAG